MKGSMESGGKLDMENRFNSDMLRKNCNGIYNRWTKRWVDLLLATVLLIFLSPLFLIISLAILIDSGGPVFYIADRAGYRNGVFKIYKFRTMVKNADQSGSGTTALNDSRITKAGGWLRKTKMDEIPQLINIIKGEMSFIGPRPELLKYTSAYREEEAFILEVRPGITDYSSLEFINLDEVVGGDNPEQIYERFVLKRKNRLRVMYVARLSLKEDTVLFFKTIIKTTRKAVLILSKRGRKNGKNPA